MPETFTETELYALCNIIIFLILFGLLIKVILVLKDFSQELRYLNCEIRRSMGEERKCWIQQRRRLWLSLLPFVEY